MYCTGWLVTTDSISSKFMHNKAELDRQTFTTTNNFLKTLNLNMSGGGGGREGRGGWEGERGCAVGGVLIDAR